MERKWICYTTLPKLNFHIKFYVMRQIFIICSLILLAGCTSDVQRLHDLNPSANDFQTALASEYQAYADSESEQWHYFVAEHFADKGLKALKGENVEPDMPDTSLSTQQQQDLLETRGHLLRVLSSDVKKIDPQQSARAQLLFDCWQQELKDGANQEQAPCVEEFHSTFQQLQEVSDPLIYGKMITHDILFADKSTKLDQESMNTIKDVASKVAGLPHYRVQLDMYIGTKSSQRKLSEARLSTVRHALIKAGVSEHAIHIHKRGSAKAVILSGDKVAMDTKKITITIKIRSQAGENK